MMLTQRFAPDDIRREGAFLWNCAGMNVGFFIGFAVAGHDQLTEDHTSLFLFATIGNFASIVLALCNWQVLADLNTPLLEATPRRFRTRSLAGVGILVGLVPLVWIMLQYASLTGTVIKWICVVVALGMVWHTARHRDRQERDNMWA